MQTIRFTPDPKYAIYDDTKFVFKTPFLDNEKIQPSVELFLQPNLVITASADELCKINYDLIDAMKLFVTKYKLFNITTTEVVEKLKKILKHLQNIQEIMKGDDKFNKFIYDFVAPILLDMHKSGQNIMPFDRLFYDTPEIQITVIERLLEQFGNLPKHRPTDSPMHQNSINRDFIKKLMDIFQRATGQRVTASSVSTNNRFGLPLLAKFKNTTKYALNSKSQFEVFADQIIHVINDSYPGLNNGYSITINVNHIIKTINKK